LEGDAYILTLGDGDKLPDNGNFWVSLGGCDYLLQESKSLIFNTPPVVISVEYIPGVCTLKSTEDVLDCISVTVGSSGVALLKATQLSCAFELYMPVMAKNNTSNIFLFMINLLLVNNEFSGFNS